MLSLAGLPPGILGLVAKVAALRPVVASELWLLAVVAAVNAVLGVAVYLRWLRVVIASVDAPPQASQQASQQASPQASQQAPSHAAPDSGSDAPVAARAVRAHPATLVAVGLSALALVLTSLSPQLVLGLLGP